MDIDFDRVTALIRQTKPLLLDSRKAAEITEKGRADYVTAVDLSVQSFLVDKLEALVPGIQFVCEEGEPSRVDWDQPVWILDPVDGTTNLIHDFHASAVSLGLWNGSAMEYGCVYNPFREELYRAERGRGAFLNGERIHVSTAGTLAHSVVVVGTAPWDKSRADQVFRTIEEIFQSCEDIRRTGSAALDCCSVACGRAEGFFEYDLKPWDYAAGSLLVEEAGGRFTDLEGRGFRPDHRADLIATNGRIHQELVDCLSRSARREAQ